MLNFAYNSPAQLTVRELGLESPDLPVIDPSDRSQMPAGGGRWPVPPHLNVVGLINQHLRSYHWQHDAALKKSREDAVACRNDPVIWSALREAQLPVSQLGWVLKPLDETDPEQVRAAAKNTLAIAKTPRLQMAFLEWEEAIWYGRHALQLTYQWDDYQPDLMRVRDWSPINGDSLVARWANTDWGVLVNYAYEGETEQGNLGRVHYFTKEEREAVVVHTHEPEAPDWYDTIGAGSIRGLGLRSRVFWYWYIKANVMASMLDLTERLGQGIWLAGYDQSNPNGRRDMEQAIAEYRSKRVLSIPQNARGESPYSLKIMEPGSASHAVMTDLIRYLDGMNRSVILGHPVGADASVNVGGDTAALFGDSISRTTKYHAGNLAETLTRDWIPTLYRYNSPNVPPGIFEFTTDHPNAGLILQYSQALREMGYAVDLDKLGALCGVPKGTVDSTISTKVQSMNPVATTDAPQSVPVAGEPQTVA